MKGNVDKTNGGGRRGRTRRADADNRLAISVPEAAKSLGISRNYGYELVRRGELPAVRVGGRLLIPLLALEKRLEQGLGNGV